MPWTRFRKKRDMPEGLWIPCANCGETLYKKDLDAAAGICKSCGHHHRLSAAQRIASMVDSGSFDERWTELCTKDRLEFNDKLPYREKLSASAKKAKTLEAARGGVGTIGGRPVAICSLDFTFMGGSMGTVVGEKVTRTIETAIAEQIPCIVVSCSGGARMHEGALSLMQMAKTSAALARLDAAGGMYISVLANPATGGVMASFAALGDLIFAEPGALIGFAGPRVIKETLRVDLPEGFQTSEFLLEHGFIDRIVARDRLATEIGQAIDLIFTYPESVLARFRREAEARAPATSTNGHHPEALEQALAEDAGSASSGAPSDAEGAKPRD